ncbi:MAG: HPr(Ser) kinase/phosphatase [Metamycoplasmataceae bacterium]
MKNKKELNQEINVLELCKENKLEIANEKFVKNWSSISRPAINRAGLELRGYFYSEDCVSKNIIGWGTSESKWMSTISREEKEKSLKNLISKKPPLIICSSGVEEDNRKMIIEIASTYGVPVVLSDLPLSSYITTIGVYLAEKFAQTEFVHGSLVIINGIGVMIIGASGVGKSEVILELIQKNHIFVSDDAVHIKRIGNNFIGSSPEITKDILEARGLGLMDIRSTYGDRAIRTKTNIDLVVELNHSEDISNFDRIGNKNLSYSILGGKINKINIPVKAGRSVSSLVVAAANLFVSKQSGIDALKIIEERSIENGKL